MKELGKHITGPHVTSQEKNNHRNITEREMEARRGVDFGWKHIMDEIHFPFEGLCAQS